MKKLLYGYKKVVGVIGRFNTILILSVIYWLVLPVFALAEKLKKKKKVILTTTWQTKESFPDKFYERQF